MRERGEKMVITKTRFMNYMRCPRYVALDMLKDNYQKSDMTYEEYLQEEIDNKSSEIISSLHEAEVLEEGENEHLEVMMPYYTAVEIEASKYIHHKFGGNTISSPTTFKQEAFDYKENGIKFLCYVDIYNESNDQINIIEVKATTSKKFADLGGKLQGEHFSIFEVNGQGIYQLKTNPEEHLKKKWPDKIAKLMDRFDSCGRYVYDLAIQRYIIEQDLKNTNRHHLIPKINYYLAVLNHEYVFTGEYINGQPNYLPDENGNEIIRLIDLTEITANMQDKVHLMKERIFEYIMDANTNPVPVGKWCEKKKNTKCNFADYCFASLPATNNVFAYTSISNSKINEHDALDLINAGMVKLSDVPYDWLSKKKHIEIRDAYDQYTEYIDHIKIKAKLDDLIYPLYHLDFETFAAPLPRFKGEKCYSQSLFQYSLHIEKEPGLCDKDQDHFEFLATNNGDERRALMESLISHINTDKPGTIVVYNESFEKTRLKEMAKIYPDLKADIYKMLDMVFDLMYLLKGNEKMFTALGFAKEESSMFNYYHPGLSGSYSIKKVLPVFTDLSYKDLVVGNGIEAMTVYAKFQKMDPVVYEEAYHNLLLYCKQDTWAMVEILQALRKKNVSTSVERIAL